MENEVACIAAVFVGFLFAIFWYIQYGKIDKMK